MFASKNWCETAATFLSKSIPHHKSLFSPALTIIELKLIPSNAASEPQAARQSCLPWHGEKVVIVDEGCMKPVSYQPLVASLDLQGKATVAAASIGTDPSSAISDCYHAPLTASSPSGAMVSPGSALSVPKWCPMLISRLMIAEQGGGLCVTAFLASIASITSRNGTFIMRMDASPRQIGHRTSRDSCTCLDFR